MECTDLSWYGLSKTVIHSFGYSQGFASKYDPEKTPSSSQIGEFFDKNLSIMISNDLDLESCFNE